MSLEGPRARPGLGQGIRIFDAGLHLESVRTRQSKALEDVHLRAVLHAPVEGQRRVVDESDGIHDQGGAFPMSDRIAIEGGVGALGMGPAVGVDMAHLHECLDVDRDLPRTIEDLERIGLAHDRGHSRGKTVGAGGVLVAARSLLGYVRFVPLGIGCGERGLCRGCEGGGIHRHFPDSGGEVGQLADL